MLKGKTQSGFEYKISDERLENYELLEAIGEFEENNGSVLVMPKVVNLLLGKSGAKALKDHVRAENGLVSAQKMSDEISEIFKVQKALKNS